MTRPAAFERKRAVRPSVLWAVPGAVYFAVFALVPLVGVLGLSFTSWEGIGNPRWTGADNWTRLLDDGQVHKAVGLSLALTALSWLFQTPVALLLGVWAAGRQKTRAVLSAIFFVPLLASSTAIALIWGSLLDPNFGIAPDIGPWIGFGDGNILGDSRGAFLAVVFVTGWQFIPFHTLLYQAGTRQIPQSLYDAAAIDGANRVQRFFVITLPQLRNTVVSSSVLMVVGALTYFDTVLVLTGGGPGDDTSILPYLMYTTGFDGFEMGYASAMAAVLVVVATTVSLVMVRLTGFGRMRSTREGM